MHMLVSVSTHISASVYFYTPRTILPIYFLPLPRLMPRSPEWLVLNALASGPWYIPYLVLCEVRRISGHYVVCMLRLKVALTTYTYAEVPGTGSGRSRGHMSAP